MKIAIISDTHSQQTELQLDPCDMIIHAGDVSQFSKGGGIELVNFLDWLHNQKAKHKIFIAGNHDMLIEKMNQQLLESIMPPDVKYLNDSMVEIDGIKIWGSPITPTFFNWAFNRDRGSMINQHWDLIPEGIDILVTHGPPRGILDNNLGCDDLKRALSRIKPSVHIFGHIHSARGYTEEYMINHDKPIKFYNAALVNQEYKIVHKPFYLEFNKM